MFVDAFEGREDVLDVIAANTVQVKESRIEIGHQFSTLGFIPFVQSATVFRLKTAAREVTCFR